jgi:hypothetical protein
MKKIIGLFSALFIAFCVGTVLSLAVFFTVLAAKGGLSGDRFMAMLAAIQGVDMASAAANVPEPQPNDEQVSFDQILQKRALAGLDIDLRESALDKGLGDLRILQSQIETERRRLDQWKQSFDQRLSHLETAATDISLRELQTTLEAMNPKQAKEQILKMLDSPPMGDVDQPMRDIVTIMKTMPIDKRKKIIGEFKTPEETEKLAEILREIRLGLPDSELIRDTRDQLQQHLNPSR